MAKTHIASDETLVRVAAALEALAAKDRLEWDSANHRYTPESVARLLANGNDGLAYGVSQPKTATVACAKLGANAGIAAPTPGYVGTPAVDPYVGRGPFRHYDVNGYVGDDGYPYVTAFEWDAAFRRDGGNGDVWVLTPMLYVREAETTSAVEHWASDTRLPGFSPFPKAGLPDGRQRPYLMFAKYAGCKGDDGYMHSYSGHPVWNYAVSHNSLITQCRTATTGYSGKSVADDYYVKLMFLLKYATKHSQSVLAGCTNYNCQYYPTVAETGVTRVVVSKANAANLLVGSAVTLGTRSAGNSDRGQATMHDVLDATRILRVEDYDASNSAVYLDAATAFNTATTYMLSTAPWYSGALDAVEGDGAVTASGRTNGREPFKLQGIECSVGVYEALGDVIVSNDGTTGWVPYVNPDSHDEATSLTSAYVSCGAALPTDASDSWKYPLYASTRRGLMYGATTGGSQTTGMCDGHYTNKLATTGIRVWLSVGYLDGGGLAGLWYVNADGGVAGARWHIGSRLSANGRSRG